MSAHTTSPNDKIPCNFDHNGECLVCDCWPSDCAYLRYMEADYIYETKEQLEKMFKPQVNNSLEQ